MKQKHKYIILVLLFIVLVASITFTYLYIHYKDQGTGEFIKRYSEIKYSNINVNNESDLSVKLNETDNSFHIEIPSLSYNEIKEFNIDVTNIGNIDVVSDNYQITNVVSNVSDKDIIITSTLNKDDVIKGGESKKIIVRVRYIGKNTEIIPYYNFNINYSFKEQKL